MPRHTEVAIQGEQFLVNGQATHPGTAVEGLLLNSRMVQAIFDDANPETRGEWAYPDTGVWDPERNTEEFIAAMPDWRAHGLDAFTINLQGGNPRGYAHLGGQGLENSAFDPDGSLRAPYLARLERVLDRADELGFVVIVGVFYFGQERIFGGNEDAIRSALRHAIDWLFDHDYRNVLVEVNNETNIVYKTPLLQPERVCELIRQVREHTRAGRRFLVSTSYGGDHIPLPSTLEASDFVLLHGNSVEDPARIGEMVEVTRRTPGYHPMPIVFNEDDHFEFDQPENNMLAAIRAKASWGYFDYRFPGEGYEDGYQSVPVDWRISSDRKRGFFGLVRKLTAG